MKALVMLPGIVNMVKGINMLYQRLHLQHIHPYLFDFRIKEALEKANIKLLRELNLALFYGEQIEQTDLFYATHGNGD